MLLFSGTILRTSRGSRTSLMYVRCNRIVKYIFWNKSINIDTRNIILLPLDSFHRNESNEYKIIKIQSVVIEITRVCSLKFLKNIPKISKFLKILYDQ